MFILRLSIVTCAFYLGITLLLVLGMAMLVHLRGSVWYLFNWRSVGLLFGLIWLLSFGAAWHIVFNQFVTR
jgi:hypothetical protein